MALGFGWRRRPAGHVVTVGVGLWQGVAMDLAYRVVNVFTVGDDPFSGNPLAVFEDAVGVTEAQMQAIARQFNLSETTFVTARGARPSWPVSPSTPSTRGSSSGTTAATRV